MEKEEFKALSVKKQIDYINENFKNGKSLNETTKELGVSKSISEKFKKHGYVLKEVLGVKQYVEGRMENPYEDPSLKQGNLFETAATTEKVKEVPLEKRNPGRPAKQNLARHNITIDDTVWKKLAMYALLNDTTVSELLGKMAQRFLEENNIGEEVIKSIKKL